MNEAPSSSPRGRRSRIAAASALVVAIAVALYLVLASGSNGDRNTSANSASTYSGSATVLRRNLVEQDTESGTLGHARAYTVYNRVSGTITWLPSAGDVIKPGQTLFRVDNKPVLLMDGTTPAYRDLESSDSPGPDILELNANLVDLGYNPDGIVVDDTWQAATTAAVKELQHDLGEGQSGKILLGKIVFLPGKQLVTTVQGTVGATVSLSDPTPHAEFVSLDTTSTNTTSSTETSDLAGTTPTTTPATTPATTPTTTPTDSTPTTTTPPATTTTPPPVTTTGTTTTPRTTTGTATTPKTHTNTTPAGTTSTGTSGHHPSTTTTPGSQTPHSTTTPGGSDNLSQKTLRALLQLIRQQQQALAHEQSPSQNGHSPSSSSNSPSSSSNSPSHSSNSPSHSSNSPSHSSNSPSSSSKSPSHSSNSPSSSSNSPSSSSNSPSSSSHSPSSSSKNPSASGGGGAGTAIMDTTSTQLVVTVDLSPSSQSEAVVGGHVTVEMPDGSTVPGTITAVSSVAQSSSSSGATGNTGSGGGGSSSVPVTITLDKHVSGKGLDQAAVSVNFVQARANHVLSVPVTALLATSGSTYAVQEAARPHTLIPVKTGMFAAGYVEISGPGIHPGLHVTDSQG